MAAQAEIRHDITILVFVLLLSSANPNGLISSLGTVQSRMSIYFAHRRAPTRAVRCLGHFFTLVLLTDNSKLSRRLK
jgi:hypothetical protein